MQTKLDFHNSPLFPTGLEISTTRATVWADSQ